MRKRTLRAIAYNPSGTLALDPEAIGAYYSPYGGQPEAPFETVGACAVVEIEGPLCQKSDWCYDDYGSIQSRFAAALADRNTTSVILRIDSPGGEVAGCWDAVRQMAAAKAASGKPVIACADEMIASAAYALASIADQIILPDSGRVGSVGVITALRDRVQANALAGINVRVISSGARKMDGHPDVPISPEATDSAQATVDALGGTFADLVAENRPKIKASAVLALKGAMFTGQAAVDARLADKVGSFADAVTLATSLGKKAAKSGAGASLTTHGPRAQGPRMKTIFQALGLSDEASEADALAALTRLQGQQRELLAATGKQSPAEALGHVRGLVATAAAYEGLQAQRAKELAITRKAEADQAFAKAKAEGRLTPAMEAVQRAEYERRTKAFEGEPADRHLARVGEENDGLRGYLASLPVLPGLAAGTAPREPEAPPSLIGAKYEDMTVEQKHRLAQTDRKGFLALREDYRRRTGNDD
jgi:ClpP class serine protease